MNGIRVFIVVDNSLLREVITALLANDPGNEGIGTAENGAKYSLCQN